MATLVDYRSVLDNSRYFSGVNGKGHIPGYLGHTPQLRYSFGKTYGTQTRELETARYGKSIPLTPRQISTGATDYQYPNATNVRREAISMPLTARTSYNDDGEPMPASTGDNTRYTRNMIPGYTGYIPRWPFKFGSTYKRECDDCLDEFGNMQYQKQNTARSMMTSRNVINDESQVAQYLNSLHAPKQNPKTSTSSPIPGYQGFIPRVHVSDVGLGERFYQMAKSGYTALNTERSKQEGQPEWHQDGNTNAQYTYRV